MSTKHFSWLVAMTLLAALLLLLLPGRTAHQTKTSIEPLFPELAAEVNDIDRVTVIGAGLHTVATLSRRSSGWVLEEAGGYAADWEVLKKLLGSLAQARIVEVKTANADYFSRLGVADVGDPQSSAVLIRLHHADQVRGLLIGSAASERDGQYVRLEGGEQALLIDQRLDVAAEMRHWLDRKIIDLAAAEVVEVSITHADGEAIVVRKVSADDNDFVLQDIPKDRQAQSTWTINALGGSLSDVRLEEVVPEGDIDWTGATRLAVLTADGLLAEADLVRAEDKRWMRVHAADRAGSVAAAAELPAAEPAAPAPTRQEQQSEGEPPAARDGAVAVETAAEVATDTARRAAGINQRTNGWAYALTESAFGVMTRRLEDLLKPLDTPADPQ